MGTNSIDSQEQPSVVSKSTTRHSSTEEREPVGSLISVRLSQEAFHQLAGNMGGFPFVKVVVDRSSGEIHFINDSRYKLHAEYIAGKLLRIERADLLANIDSYNQGFYLSKDEDRKYFLGIIAFHQRAERSFFSLETVEVDNMNMEMLQSFYNKVVTYLDASIPLLFKPANHHQESYMGQVETSVLPRIFSHELYASADFVPLNEGHARGRLRVFSCAEDYKEQRNSIEWYDILVMRRVPDDIPRISGIINGEHTTPLSHTNVLATGWSIPNAVQLNIFEDVTREKLMDQWVDYRVSMNGTRVQLERIDRPHEIPQRPAWTMHQIVMETPDTGTTPICALDFLRMSDRFRYGTKAANLGELKYLLAQGSPRTLGFYNVSRPPRENLRPYLATYLNTSEDKLAEAAQDFLKSSIKVPRGITIPFSYQQEFLESSPKIQQAIGKLKMALELNACESDALCLRLQQLIRSTRMTHSMRDYIDGQITNYLSGVSSFVVRSSSNAEDLEEFSAAGIYESVNHVTSADKIFESIKRVWASLVSPRSVRLRHEVGISLDDSYMGVIVQEEVKCNLGGVLVTTNPMSQASDFRNVYINATSNSTVSVVEGSEQPYQYLFNTVEGGGRTLSLGKSQTDLSSEYKEQLQKLAFAGRLLQGHFSRDYTFSAPLDIEWAVSNQDLYILQIRPYAI